MKHLLIALAALFLSVNIAHSQEATLEGKWCLCEIQTFENDNLTGEMSVGKDYIEFRADGTCVMRASKAEKEYTFDPESPPAIVACDRPCRHVFCPAYQGELLICLSDKEIVCFQVYV